MRIRTAWPAIRMHPDREGGTVRTHDAALTGGSPPACRLSVLWTSDKPAGIAGPSRPLTAFQCCRAPPLQRRWHCATGLCAKDRAPSRRQQPSAPLRVNASSAASASVTHESATTVSRVAEVQAGCTSLWSRLCRPSLDCAPRSREAESRTGDRVVWSNNGMAVVKMTNHRWLLSEAKATWIIEIYNCSTFFSRISSPSGCK